MFPFRLWGIHLNLTPSIFRMTSLKLFDVPEQPVRQLLSKFTRSVSFSLVAFTYRHSPIRVATQTPSSKAKAQVRGVAGP